jgi:hypothetical protein
MKTVTVVVVFVVMMGAQGSCEPSFFRVSDEVISDDSIGVQRQINGAIIGCAEELGKINGKEQAQLKGLLKQVLVEEGYNLIAKASSKEFRQELAGRVNSLLGRRVAADILLFGISFSE